MSLFDLAKATVICGFIAYLFFNYPVLGQVLAIAFLSLTWLTYARKTVLTLLARKRA